MSTASPSSASSPTPSPAPGPGAARPAPARQRVLAQARFETGVLLRNGEQLLVSLILPVAALLGLAFTGSPSLGEGSGQWAQASRLDLAVPGVLALAVLSTAFTGQAIATGFDRRYGVLRLLGTTPLGRGGLLAGKALAVLAVEAVQVVVLTGVGLALGWSPDPVGILLGLVVVLLGSWTFVSLALLLAGTVRAEGVLAVANLVWVALVAGGGVLVAADRLPDGASTIVSLLPSAALGDALRAALVDGGVDLGAVLVLVVWGGLASALASRTFRWSD